MEASTDFFINLIQNNPIIYNKILKDFKNTRKKDQVWVIIANQSNMTVDAAKKRYNSLRQKCSREKRNLEVKRRNKEVVRKNWIFYESLQFLDSFVVPRTTYTNDIAFEEEQEYEMPNPDECTVDESEKNDVEVGDDIDMNELDDLLFENQECSSGILKTTTDNCGNSQFGTFVSEYTGEVSTIHYTDEQRNAELLDNECSFFENATPAIITDVHEPITDQFDPSYMSPRPGTSSSKRDVINLSSSDSIAGNTLSNSRQGSAEIRKTIVGDRSVPNRKQLNETRPSLELKIQSRQDLPARNSAPSDKEFQLASNRAVSSSSTHTAQRPAISTSKDKSLEAIRNKMDSCLNAINNKVIDKGQRSPHAPFLAYLGTKLQDVPKEKISDLEREILDLVKSASN